MSENKNFFRASAEDFKKIPGSPVAYWAGKSLFDDFASFEQVGERFEVRNGITTSDNDRFLRLWHEISLDRFKVRWFPCNKGGTFRKWCGNREYLVDWECDGMRLKTCFDAKGKLRPTLRGIDMNFKSGITMSRVTSMAPSFRLMDADSVSESATNALYPKNLVAGEKEYLLALLNSQVGNHILNLLNPTINVVPEDLRGLPIPYLKVENVKVSVDRLAVVALKDWNEYETSWDFAVNPLLAARNVSGASDESEFQLSALYVAVREKWAKDCEEMRRLETENNRIFIEAYGLQDELTPEVPWHEITLTCNPWYRYGVKVDSGQCAVGSAASDHCTLPTDHLLEERLRGDTVKELISYAVGCMMGRYSLEKPGLILADQGAQISDQWIVVSGQLVLRGKVAECVRKELQRIDCLAEGDGSCGRSVSTGETAPDGGTVCIVGSASSGGGFNSVECRRGAGAEYDAGLHELSDNGTRVVLRDGNTIVDLCSAEVLDAIASGSGAELVRRGWKDAERIDWKTIHSSLTTSHFSPDEDGIIPILDNDWFADDIVTRFREFIKVAFGEENFFANMAWIEEALGKNLRDYFTKDFYKDHLQRYQNRPIYWLFQSPKGAFRALVYMHRYKPDMDCGVRSKPRSSQPKVENQLGVATQIASDESKSSTERVRANKEVVKYAKMQKELDEYEKNVLYPISTERIEIDLDDGVKVNYRKFGTALRKVAALEGKGE